MPPLRLVAVLVPALLGGVAAAAPPHWAPRCADHTCRSRVLVDDTGAPVAAAGPSGGITALQIEAAYRLDVTRGADATVAVVDAYGYKDLEADLAVYRATFGLPPCTVASGCLRMVNDDGDPAPLPADDNDWIGETALDVDMISAACPLCKIVVVQASTSGAGLDIGQIAAVKLGVTSISNSWGGPEDNFVTTEEGSFNNPGIGTFSGGGDNGFDSVQMGETGPTYPSTSAYVIAVGGTTLTVDSTTARGFAETAWRYGGSSCSEQIVKPAFQPSSAQCAMRAATDVSAVADGGNQGIATYIAKQGGWQQVDGTSAASPLTAAIFAAAGHGDAVPGFLYKHPEAFDDVTTGSNGTCGTNLCLAGTGWDGPTGLGTPNQAALAAIGNVAGGGPDAAITFPSDGAAVAAGFTIEITPGSDVAWVEIDLDGTKLAAVNAASYELSAPISLPDGAHVITAIAYDLDHDSKPAPAIHVTQGPATAADDSGGGCASGGTGPGAGVLLALGALATTRRRRSA